MNTKDIEFMVPVKIHVRAAMAEHMADESMFVIKAEFKDDSLVAEMEFSVADIWKTSVETGKSLADVIDDEVGPVADCFGRALFAQMFEMMPRLERNTKSAD